jgi:predicted small metal-binding protein
MERKYIDCRPIPSDSKCTVTISADTEEELMEVAVQHGVARHGHQDTPEFRQQLRQAMQTGAPPP